MYFRSAVPEDVEAIADIYRSYVRDSIATLEENEPTANRMRADFDKIFSSGQPFVVAVHLETNEVCGYAYIGTYNERSGYRHTCESSIYLHPDHYGRGIGKVLLCELFTRLKTCHDITQVVAKMSIRPDQAIDDLPSCRLHASFEFKIVGRLSKVGYKFGLWIDVVLMQAELDHITN